GADTELDLWHYERFTDDSLTADTNETTGSIYSEVIAKERAGEYLGHTVQVIPHVTDEIKSRIMRLATEDVDVVITEVGGTVGDIEILPFLYAIRQFRGDIGRQNVCYVHLTLVPYLGSSGEQKTKPTQHSVEELRSRGILPDVIVCRSSAPLSPGIKRKISLTCDVPIDGVVSAIDVDDIYEIPLLLHGEGLDDYVCRILGLQTPGPDLDNWARMVARAGRASETARIGLIGKYVNLPDSYLSVVEALRHAGFHLDARVELVWVQAEEVSGLLADGQLRELDGMVIPGGFGERGVDGKMVAAGYAREHEIPCLGLCLGLQVMVIDAARSLAGLEGAHSREFDPDTPYPVIDLMDDQRKVVGYGGTMRLGAHAAVLRPGSQVAEAYGELVVRERHRHRFEVNPRFRHRLEDAGLACVGTSADDRLVELIELPGHPFWVGTQAHPEFKSRPDRPHPLFRELVRASLARAAARQGRLDVLVSVDEQDRQQPRSQRAGHGALVGEWGGGAAAGAASR
ncbi:MAG: CTP synthase, partial [Acidimicrobiales bacterium]